MTGVVAWFTGLPSAGKSTLASTVALQLRTRGVHPVTLDGDEVRNALVPKPGYDETARTQFYATLARLAALIAREGHIVLVPATAHRRAYRDAARALSPAFVEIYVDTPHEVCARRDTKGLYAQHAADAPGVGVEYEPPPSPEIHARFDAPGIAARIAQRLDEMI